MFSQDHPNRGTVDVPFDFYVAGDKLPAGEYTLDVVASTYVTLRSKDGKRQQDLYFLQTAWPEKDPELKVVFALRDGKCYFAGVSTWNGKAQLTSFTPMAGDQNKDVPIKPVKRDVARPTGSPH